MVETTEAWACDRTRGAYEHRRGGRERVGSGQDQAGVGRERAADGRDHLRGGRDRFADGRDHGEGGRERLISSAYPRYGGTERESRWACGTRVGFLSNQPPPTRDRGRACYAALMLARSFQAFALTSSLLCAVACERNPSIRPEATAPVQSSPAVVAEPSSPAVEPREQPADEQFDFWRIVDASIGPSKQAQLTKLRTALQSLADELLLFSGS